MAVIKYFAIHQVYVTTVLQNEKYQSYIDACNACFEACEYCVINCCLHADDIKSMTKCIQFCRDCADICVLSSQYTSRDSEFSTKICAQCADICEACASECDKFDIDVCKQCAKVCHTCAEECRKMSRSHS